jgi:hypothetical protein
MKTFFLIISSFFFLGCATTKKMNEKNNNPVSQKDTPIEIKNAVLGDNKQPSLQTTINDVKLTDNVLKLTISYTGGCTKHSFELVGSEQISKSLPPIRSINLIHKSEEMESCKQLMYDTLYFNLSNLAYQKVDGSTIKLNLSDWKEQILYTFK